MTTQTTQPTGGDSGGLLNTVAKQSGDAGANNSIASDAREQAATLLSALFGAKPDDTRVLLWSLADKSSRRYLDVAKAAEYAAGKTDLYCAVALHLPGDGREGKFARGTADKTAGLVALWADIDIAGDGHKKEHLPPTEAAAHELLAAMPLPPTIVVHSGGGLQVWWMLRKPWLFEEPGGDGALVDAAGQRDRAARLARRWEALLREKARERGWVVDSVADLARVLRIPGTINAKVPDKPVAVRLLELHEDRRYAVEDFEPFLPEKTNAPAAATNGKAPAAVDAAALVLNESAEPPADRFNALVEADSKFAATWEHKRAFPSSSEYEQSLASLAAQANWPDQEIADLLIAHRRKWEPDNIKKALRRDYVERTITNARKQVATPASAAIEAAGSDRPHLTDMGNAQRLARSHGSDLRYCFPFKKFLAFDGTRWRLDDTGEVMRRAKATVLDLYREAADIETRSVREALLTHAHRSQQAKCLNAMMDLVRSEAGIPILPDQLDADPWLLNVPNGTIDLRTGKLRPHDRADRITKLCPVPLDLNADCATWLAFLDRIFAGNVELPSFLQRLAGHCLTGDISEHILPILHGRGANGKSTLVNVLLCLFGPDYSMKATPDLLLVKRGGEHPTEKADLHGKRFVAVVETAEGRRLDEAFVKEATGGDPVRTRRMREDFWQFWPTHKFALATNHRPTIKGTDDGIWRRVAMVPFAVRFWNRDRGESGPAELQADKRLGDKLKTELPGILAWAVRGCLAWQKHGLGCPDDVRAATTDYRNEQDVLGAFLNERCVIGSECRIKSSDLYAEYRDWCEKSGEHAATRQAFGLTVIERGFERYANNGTWYRGVGLTT